MSGTAPAITPQDLDKNYAIIGVQGTLGTADVKGTSPTMPIGVDEATGAMYVKDLSGAAGTTNVQILGGTVNRVQTVGTLELGTVTLTNPTGTTVQFNNGTVDTLRGGTLSVLENGTVDTQLQQYTNGDVNGTPKGFLAMWRQSGDNSVQAVADDNPIPTHVRLGTITKVEGGTLGLVTTVTNLSNGTIQNSGTTTGVGVVSMLSAGTVSMINAGTLTSSGTTTGVGVVSNLTSGSVRITVGTITTGTIVNSGTTTGVGVVSSVTNIVSGTLLNSGTTTGVGVVSSLTNGSINVTAGTVRLNPNPTIHWMPFGTITAGTIGTLVAAPSAGSSILINSLDISMVSGTAEVLVSYGLAATGNGVVNRGNFGILGGLAKTYSYPVGGSVTGSALTYNILSGSGTVAYSISYAIQIP